MTALRRSVRQALLLAAMAVSTTAFAETSPGPRWACWYESSDLTVTCLLSRTPADGVAARAAEVARTIDSRHPALVRTIWGSPEQLADRQISIPLRNVPYEMDFARQLAESVMCGARADCSVHFDVNPDGQAPVRALAMRNGADEADVMAEVLTQLAAADEQPVRRTTRRRRAA